VNKGPQGRRCCGGGGGGGCWLLRRLRSWLGGWWWGWHPCGVGAFDDMLMHVMEPSQNSADWYHFRTVHRWLAGVPPFMSLKLDHQIKAHYGSGSHSEQWGPAAAAAAAAAAVCPPLGPSVRSRPSGHGQIFDGGVWCWEGCAPVEHVVI
jgi:hypothetical protein